MTSKGYIYRGLKGWTVIFWIREPREARYLHGFDTVQEAIRVLEENWENPPEYQNGFPTAVEIP